MSRSEKLGNSRPPRKYSQFTWLFGFFGFVGFRYFVSHNMNDLFFFSFFSLFSFYFTTKLASEMPDERYEENRMRAKEKTWIIPIIALSSLVIGMTSFDIPRIAIVIIVSLGWAATFLTYALAFWYYEKYE